MLNRLRFALQLRLAVIVTLLHLGLLCAGVGVWKTAQAMEQLPPGTVQWLTVGILALYGSFVVLVLFILIPAWPWIQRARRLREWQTWAFEILPQLLALMPLVLAGFKVVKATWEEFQETGNFALLDPEKLAKKVKQAARKSEPDEDSETPKKRRHTKESD